MLVRKVLGIFEVGLPQHAYQVQQCGAKMAANAECHALASGGWTQGCRRQRVAAAHKEKKHRASLEVARQMGQGSAFLSHLLYHSQRLLLSALLWCSALLKPQAHSLLQLRPATTKTQTLQECSASARNLSLCGGKQMCGCPNQRSPASQAIATVVTPQPL